MSFDVSAIKYNEQGLVPAIAQDARTKEVLMLAYMNKESVQLSLDTGFATYFSRSRQKLWKKGETSGHLQKIRSLVYDCDQDKLLLQVEQTGPACHTGSTSCFGESDAPLLESLYQTIQARKENPKEGSYTTYLFDKGIDKILKKVGEEAAEVIIGAKNEGTEELTAEISDLVYHTLVLMVEKGVTLEDVAGVLKGRRS